MPGNPLDIGAVRQLTGTDVGYRHINPRVAGQFRQFVGRILPVRTEVAGSEIRCLGELVLTRPAIAVILENTRHFFDPFGQCAMGGRGFRCPLRQH